MGPLMFASGSHRWPSARDGTGLHDIRISDESESEAEDGDDVDEW